MRPIHGFAAEATEATILLVAGNLGMPVSTTHAITTSIMGVALAKHWKALDLGRYPAPTHSATPLIVAERIIWAWIFTIPTTGALAYDFYSLPFAIDTPRMRFLYGECLLLPRRKRHLRRYFSRDHPRARDTAR